MFLALSELRGSPRLSLPARANAAQILRPFWWNRFGPMFAANLRRQRVSRTRGFTHERWHVAEVYVKINGEMHYAWRAVDHEGEVLESLITKMRDKSAALALFKKALKRHGKAKTIVTTTCSVSTR